MGKLNKNELLEEYKEIKQNQSWKPSEGLYKVTFLSHPEKDVFQKLNDNNEIVEENQLRIFKVKIDFENGNTSIKNWEMGKGKTSRSIYYQLLEKFAEHDQVVNVMVTLRVEEGKRKTYTVLTSQIVKASNLDDVEDEYIEQ
jgi:hypothetical protein